MEVLEFYEVLCHIMHNGAVSAMELPVLLHHTVSCNKVFSNKEA